LPDRLVWPPRKEDLERMYLGQRLSAMKIAEAYGLRYASPKTAESTVLYHLRRNGIPRRDPAEHVRKVTQEMVDEWAKRYEAGASLKQIAAGSVDAVTVWEHLRKRGIVLRDKVEAQIKAVSKYERWPFDGDGEEEAFLVGLRYGDLNVVEHGRAIRVRLSTTHPDMAGLFRLLFSRYGHVHEYPRRNRLVGYEWTYECDLDQSFRFLLDKPPISELEKMGDAQFMSFLAGLFDAEGTIYMHNKRGRHNPEISLVNTEGPLIDLVFHRLRRLGYAANERWATQKHDRMGITGEGVIGRVIIWKFKEVQRLLGVLPLRHQEKVAKARVVQKLKFGVPDRKQLEVLSEWESLKSLIRSSRGEFIRAAAVELGKRESRQESSDSFRQIEENTSLDASRKPRMG
jgi:hypothetical protein